MTINKATNEKNQRQALVGIDKYLKDGVAIPVLGTSYTPAQIKAAIQADLDAAAATQTAYAAWLTAVQEERTKHATAHGVLVGLKTYLVAAYGKAKVDVFTDFGFTTPKAASTPPATLVAGAAKARATRAARHTMGKKQRLAIKAAAAPAPTAATATGPTTSPVPPTGATTRQ